MNNTNYLQEILSILNNNNLSQKPSITAIESSEDIAIATWKNFNKIPLENATHFHDWYIMGQFNEAFHIYKENIEFWRKIIEVRNFDYQFLLDADFKKDFPLIVEYFSHHDELIKAIYVNGNSELFNLLNVSPEEKENIYKKFLILYKGKIDKIGSKIKKYEKDPQFIQDLLVHKPSCYVNISKENQKNPDYIKLALNDRENLYYLTPELRKEYFSVWLEKHITYINKGVNISRHTDEEKIEIIKQNIAYLPLFVSEDLDKYKNIARDFIVNDFDKAVEEFNSDQLVKILKSDNSHNIDLKFYQKINSKLEDYIEQFNHFELSKKDNKMITIIKRHPNLKEKFKNNIYYESVSIDGKVSLEQFTIIFDFLTEKVAVNEITQDQMNKCMSHQYKKVDTIPLQQQGLNKKDIKEYLDNFLSKRELKKQLSADLSENTELIKKFKI